MSKPTGLNVSRKRLAGGETREYFYDRATGAFLGHDRGAALARLAQMRPEAPSIGQPIAGTIAALATDYKASAHYRTKLAPRTRETYLWYLDRIVARFGDIPVRGFKPAHVEVLKRHYEATPRKANGMIQVLRILFSRAVKQQLVATNPVARPELLPLPPRDQVWSAEEEAAFLAAARHPRVRLAFALLLFTAQRLTDVLAMTKGQVHEIDGRLHIDLIQRKTQTLVRVPVHARLEPLLRERLAERDDSLLLVASPKGLPWRVRNFSRAWDAAVKAAGVEDRQRRDLRRTAVVRMAEAGATTPQIVGVTGHGIDYCQKILNHYLPRRTEVATAGIAAWEAAGEKGAKVVRLARPQATANRIANRKPGIA